MDSQLAALEPMILSKVEKPYGVVLALEYEIRILWRLMHQARQGAANTLESGWAHGWYVAEAERQRTSLAMLLGLRRMGFKRRFPLPLWKPVRRRMVEELR